MVYPAGSFEINLISLLVILAAVSRSSQIPICSWLPAATPVSTLVTAGVYLLNSGPVAQIWSHPVIQQRWLNIVTQDTYSLAS
jgi:NADH:ubiquinone oxidoreductase subunit 5 (subunit L)/multisubunit Na+/H+ antiporter MnhA subunit